jgi:hypothetical protein
MGLRTAGRLLFGFLITVIIPACGGQGTPGTLANPPTNLVATSRGSARIDLTWTDNSDNEFDFTIERGDALAGPFVQVGTAPKNATAYSDLGLLPGHTYYYQVAAWNSRGNSAFAGPASATTRSLAWAAGPMTGGPPVGRGNHSAVFDSFAQQMILFGGVDDTLTVRNDLWFLDLRKDPIAPTAPAISAWSAPANTGAPARLGHSAVFDTAYRRMIVFGGQDSTFTPTNDVYVLELSGTPPYTWTKLIASGPAPTITGVPPSARFFHTAVYDSGNQQMIVYGGNDGSSELPSLHLLSLPASFPFAWSTPVAPGPIARSQHASIMDPLRSRMVVFGGEDNNGVADGSPLNNETWTFSTTTNSWSPLFFSGTPGFRSGHSGVYDAPNQRMLVFGGTISVALPGPVLTNELWSLKLDSIPSWSILNPTLPPGPTPRYGHSAVYDSVFNRMVIYGGYDATSTSFNELWVIKL